jgi:hypothetical protein
MPDVTPIYNWPIPEDTDLVKDGAEAIRDLAGAIETTVDSSPTGLIHINTTSFSAVASQSLDDVFTSDYENYFLTYTGIKTTSGTHSLRFRTSGTDNSATSYHRAISGWETSTSTAQNLISGSQSSIIFGSSLNNGQFNFAFNIFRPQVSAWTIANLSGFASLTTGQALGLFGSSGFLANTVFDGISFILSAGTITGEIRVYGYRNS